MQSKIARLGSTFGKIDPTAELFAFLSALIILDIWQFNFEPNF